MDSLNDGDAMNKLKDLMKGDDAERVIRADLIFVNSQLVWGHEHLYRIVKTKKTEDLVIFYTAGGRT